MIFKNVRGIFYILEKFRRMNPEKDLSTRILEILICICENFFAYCIIFVQKLIIKEKWKDICYTTKWIEFFS